MDFDSKFELIIECIKLGIIKDRTYPNFREELIDIVTTQWADELEQGGFYSIYEHLKHHDFKPTEEWTLEELMHGLFDVNRSYFEDEDVEFTDCHSLREFNKLVDNTFTVIELAKLMGIANAKHKMSTTAASET